MSYFDSIQPVEFDASGTTDGLAYRQYNPAEMVLGKSMKEHLRLAVCYWHTFVWPGI